MTPVVGGGAFRNVAEFAAITVRTNPEELKNQGVAALIVRVRGALLPSEVLADNWVLIKELGWRGHGRREAIVQASETDPPASDGEFLSAVLYGILRDDNFGFPRVIQDHIGTASDQLALRHAHQLFRAELDRHAAKTFIIQTEAPALLPEEGETVSILGALYRLEDWALSVAADGRETITLYVIDDTDTSLM